MDEMTSLAAKYAQVLKNARNYLGTNLPDSEVLVIAGNVRIKPPALAGCLGLGGFYQRFMVISEKRFLLMTGALKPNKIQMEMPLTSLRSMAIRKGDLTLRTTGEDLVLQFPLLNVGGASFGTDVVTCLARLGVRLEGT